MDQRRIVRVLLENRGRLTGYAVAILRSPSDTDDVFQDVCLRAMESPDTFESDQHLVHWAMTVTRNLAIDALRKSERANRQLDAAVLDTFEQQFGDIAGGGSVDTEIDEALEHCIGKLTDDQRDLLDLKYRSALSTGDVAKRTDRSRDAIYKAMARIHTALFKCITGRVGAPGIPGDGGPRDA